LAIDSGHGDRAPKAAFNLGVLREDRGDAAGAERAYQLAIDSGHADQAPKAADNLGVLREGRGDFAGAERAFQLAIDSGHVDQDPKAAINLGVLREGRGDLACAERAYQLAIDSGHADKAPQAVVNLGVLRHGREDYAGAEWVFQLAIDCGHADMAPKAAVNLGVLREGRGDIAGRSGPTSWPSTPGIQRRLHLRERRASSYGDATPSLDKRAEQVFLLAVDAVLCMHFLSADKDGQPLPYRRIKTGRRRCWRNHQEPDVHQSRPSFALAAIFDSKGMRY
jgi:tetratricopeptide (TPR) repeat protein